MSFSRDVRRRSVDRGRFFLCCRIRIEIDVDRVVGGVGVGSLPGVKDSGVGRLVRLLVALLFVPVGMRRAGSRGRGA